MTPEELLDRHPREGLRFLRQRLRLTQAEFAVRVGVAPKTVARWETGEARMAPLHARRVFALLAPALATPEGEVLTRLLGRGM
jgi:transcriptional regulator with XRE-family HTH domain